MVEAAEGPEEVVAVGGVAAGEEVAGDDEEWLGSICAGFLLVDDGAMYVYKKCLVYCTLAGQGRNRTCFKAAASPVSGLDNHLQHVG